MEPYVNVKEEPQESVCSTSVILPSFRPEEDNKRNTLDEIFGASSSSRPQYVATNNDQNLDEELEMEDEQLDEEVEMEDHELDEEVAMEDHILHEEEEVDSYRTAKRRRYMEYRILREKKRQKILNEKLDTLLGMMNISTQGNMSTKLQNVIEYVQNLIYTRDVMAMAYARNPFYTPQYYGTHAPCMYYPWGYYAYAPTMPMVPQQNMPYIPRYNQVQVPHNTARPEEAKPEDKV